MSGLIVPQVVYGLSNDELAELVAKALKEIDWAFNGNISDQNISRIANFLASKTEFKHISGLVGLSGYDAANPLAVRIWAGNADKSLGPFRVLQNGYMYSTRGFIGGWDIDTDRLSGTGTIEGGTIIGSEIMTALSGVYPRSAMSVTESLFVAEQSANEFIKMMSDYLGAVALLIYSSTVNGMIGPVGDVLLINTAHTKGGIQVSSGGDLELYADILDPTKVVKVNAWNRFVNVSTGDNLQYELSRLQSGIDSKQPLITSGDVTVIDGVAYLDNTGIAPGTWSKATYGADGRATVGANLVAADIPTLAPSKISTDSSNRFVTDTEKSTWSAKAPTASPTFTVAATLPAATTIGTLTAAELAFVHGVTSSIQTQLDGKASKTIPAWATLTLQNSWVVFNSETPQYYKDDMGRVWFRGRIKNGTAGDGTTIFTMPVGYRPSAFTLLNTTSNNGTSLQDTEITIDTNGVVNIYFAANTYLTLGPLMFRAE